MPNFTNMDARWLAELSKDLLKPVVNLGASDAARLAAIAEHLQSMEEKLVNLQSFTATYDQGVADERARWLSRSNLPLQSVELSPELAMAMAKAATTIKPRKVSKEKPKPKEEEFVDPLAHITIDLDFDL